MKKLIASVLVTALCFPWAQNAWSQKIPDEIREKYDQQRLKKLREGGRLEDIYDASFDYPEFKYLDGQLSAMLALAGASFFSGAGWFLGGLGVTGVGVAEFASGHGEGHLALAGAWMITVAVTFVIVGVWSYAELERVSDELVDGVNQKIREKLMKEIKRES